MGISMQEAKKGRLRAAWHGPLNAGQVARANAVGEAWLKKFWAGEKTAGRLPAGPRPHFLDRVKRDEPSIADAVLAIEDVTGLDADESPIADPNRVCKAECGALLDALHAHHPDRAGAQESPADWLRFDRKGMPTPTHAVLIRMCRVLDAIKALAPLMRVPGRGVPA
jgi:hypothetical protein